MLLLADEIGSDSDSDQEPEVASESEEEEGVYSLEEQYENYDFYGDSHYGAAVGADYTSEN
jgi:hypothetical protein